MRLCGGGWGRLAQRRQSLSPNDAHTLSFLSEWRVHAGPSYSISTQCRAMLVTPLQQLHKQRMAPEY